MHQPDDYFPISPHYLSRYVNFNYKDDSWQYQPTRELSSMQNVQAEGATAIWNRLIDDRIVLLADEVGMGKTIQALAVMATLWRQNPRARVLVYAPRESVAYNWLNEYYSFIYNHYRVKDDLVKISLGDFPAKKSFYCHNHGELLNQCFYHEPQFLLEKTSSFSSLRNIRDQIEDTLHNQCFANQHWEGEEGHIENFEQIGIDSRQFLKKHFNKENEPPFDLLILDEAHYYRNIEGGSQKVQAAKGFFGDKESPLAKHVLLMTATPNHSGKQNIYNIFSYFRDLKGEYLGESKESIANKEEIAKDLLNKYCIRRLRRLSKQGYTKYNYRKETPDPAQFHSLKESLFFGLYHKALHDKMEKDEKNRHSTNLMFGYLEGFEFTNPRPADTDNDSSDKESDDSVDFRTAPDSQIIQDLGNKYHDTFQTFPPHPKYEKAVEQLGPSNEEIQKKVVYVRRIASTKEISNRVIQKYDEWLWDKMKKGLKLPNNLKIPKDRDQFNAAYRKQTDELTDDHLIEGEDEDEDNEDNVPQSKILHLFKKLKKGRHTTCENFRLKFEKPEGPFYLFFLPPSDHLETPYYLLFLNQTKGEKDQSKYNYKLAAGLERKQKTGKNHVFQEILKYDVKSSAQHPSDTSEFHNPFPTLLSIFLSTASQENADPLFMRAYEEYRQWDAYEKEGFSNFLRKGILQASTYVVDLFIWFENLKNNDYREFCKKVEENLASIGLDFFIANLILHFRHTYQKHLAINNSKDLIGENWRFLEKLNPAYPYSGDTKRAPIIKAFNTLFFPNVLVATSVLQEGVNLQNHCDSVIHYGIAWTPGDNEQRIGRVDRMYSRIERNLDNDSSASLDIGYPYLLNTLDEDQLRNFASKKVGEEEIIDRLEETISDKEIKPEQGVDEDNWHEKFFRKPLEKDSNDPYPPTTGDLKSNDDLPKVVTLEGNLNKKIATFINHLTVNDPIYWVEAFPLYSPQIEKNICLINQINSQLIDGREQPVIIEAQYLPEISTKLAFPAYCLMLKTPLGSKNPYEFIKDNENLFKLYRNHPYLKLASDPNKRGENLFNYYLRVDLPFHSSKNSETLSQIELKTAVEDLISVADQIEKTFYNDQQDIKNKELAYKDPIEQKSSALLREAELSYLNLQNWQSNSNDKCLFRQYPLSTSEKNDLTFNHEHPLVRLDTSSKHSTITQAYWQEDFQQNERQIFDECLDWVKSNLS